jgi:hypothetical protein
MEAVYIKFTTHQYLSLPIFIKILQRYEASFQKFLEKRDTMLLKCYFC